VARRLAGPNSFTSVAAADHAFSSHLDALEAAVKGAVPALRAAPTPAPTPAQPPAA
jgi:hypothetical protein